MSEFQLKRVERLTFEAIIYRMVQIIRRKRMADVSHMHPNLMGAPGFKMNFQKRMFVFDFQSFIVSDSRFSAKKVYMPFNN